MIVRIYDLVTCKHNEIPVELDASDLFAEKTAMAINKSSFVEDTESKLETLAQWIHEAETVVWFTGAGISTDSGLPDFRGPDGVWTRRDKGLPPPRANLPREMIVPNAAHHAIVEFEKMGKCAFLISQNVDNLHIASGYPFEKLAELHGNQTRLRCRRCEMTYAADDVAGSSPGQASMQSPAACPECGKPLEDSVINFGDAMPDEDLDNSFEWAVDADLMIVVGSSCVVTPAAHIPMATKERGGRLVIMNIGKTGLEDLCDLRFSQESVGELLPELLERVKAIT